MAPEYCVLYARHVRGPLEPNEGPPGVLPDRQDHAWVPGNFSGDTRLHTRQQNLREGKYPVSTQTRRARAGPEAGHRQTGWTPEGGSCETLTKQAPSLTGAYRPACLPSGSSWGLPAPRQHPLPRLTQPSSPLKDARAQGVGMRPWVGSPALPKGNKLKAASTAETVLRNCPCGHNMHTSTHPHTGTLPLTHIHLGIHSHKHTVPLAYAHTHMHTLINAQHSPTHVNTHALTPIPTYTHAHAHSPHT